MRIGKSPNRSSITRSTMANASAPAAKGKWSNLPKYASFTYFVLIIFQVPLFRIQCRSGMCTTPIHVTASQLISSEIFPLPVVKTLLYPGAIVNGLATSMSFPSWNNLLSIYNLTNIKEASPEVDLQRLEVLAGSYFCVAGSLVGLLKQGRMNMFGTLLVIWGLLKEGILGKPANTDPQKAVFVYPTMMIAVLCAFLSVKYNLKKIAQNTATQPAAKPLKSSSKAKLK